MPPTTSIAHAKLILMGEHAAVYGHPAIALPLPLTVVCSAFPLEPGNALPFWTLRSTSQSGSELSSSNAPSLDSRTTPPLARALQALGPDLPPLGFSLQCAIPLGAGLGSSAAIGVAIARAWLRAAGHAPTEAEVFRRAQAWEGVFHARPSGVDVTTAAADGPILFERGRPARALTLRLPFALALVDTGDRGSTSAMVQLVGEQLASTDSARASTAKAHIDALGSLVPCCVELLELPSDMEPERSARQLGGHLNQAQAHLSSLGLSTPRIDQRITEALAAGAFGAKLSGAGGGGVAFAVGPADAMAQLASDWSAQGSLSIVLRYAGA